MTPAAERLAKRFLRQPERAAARLLEPALVLLLAWMSADLLFALVTPVNRPAATAMAVPEAAPTPARDYRALLGFDPFQRESPAGRIPSSAPVAESTLDLALFGIRAGAEGGSAVIRTPDKQQKVYGAGAELLPGVTLAEIRPDMVVIERNGRREGLFLPGDPQRRQRVRTYAFPLAGSADLLEGVSLRPRFVEGRIDGIVVEFPGTATLLQRKGLISGDVLLAANGVPIDSVAAVRRLVRDLEGATAILIDLERQGERRQVRLSIEG